MTRRVPRLAPVEVEREDLGGGAFVLRSAQPLQEPTPTLGVWLARGAERTPSATLLAERAGDGWRRLSWAEAWQTAQAIGRGLRERGLGLGRPVVILSGNGVDHALLTFGAYLAGVPVVPVSVAYSLLSRDHARLRAVCALVTPGLIFVDHGARYAGALDALELDGVEVVVSHDPPRGRRCTPFAELCAGDALEESDVGPDTVAKILLTSGSTGQPKGVLNTHRMLTANQQAMAQIWPFVEETPPVLVDWLPWSHTFGGNHNLHLVLRNGGTLYVDGGKPTPTDFPTTLRNLREVSPTIQFNVPVGWAQLARALEEDASLAERFFARVEVLFYAAAALPQDTWARLDAVAERTLGHRVWLTTSWGSTETSPLVTNAHFPADAAGNIGVPVPGCALKFAPHGGKLELRIRGPNVTPGYHRDPERTAAAFDEDGYYRSGDGGRLVDPERPSAGVSFDGRVAEDFKLSSGTWVHAAKVRTEVLSAARGLFTHAVLAGHDRQELTLLAWLDAGEAGRLAGGEDPTTHAAVRAAVRERLTEYNAANGGSSKRIARVRLMRLPLEADAGELTDKGYVNAGRVLERRADDVAALYVEPFDGVVVV